MTFMIEMVRDSVEAGGRDRFSLSADAWGLLQDVGKTFGWKPIGTTYARKPSANAVNVSALRDYLPGDSLDPKVVTADDAMAWATALSQARQSPHLGALIGFRPGAVVLHDLTTMDESRSANAPFTVSMDEFIEYAFGGAFSFARAER